MTILVSNDDGIDAQGIHYLRKAVADLDDTVVMAPDRDRSGASHALTLDRPLRINAISDNAYRVGGTPSDCVHLALTGFLDKEPDLVVSGINLGANLGDDVLYSGTVAAAMEACNMGIAGMAFSLVGKQHMQTAAYVAKTLVTHWQQQLLPAQVLLNVNVPDVPVNELKGFVLTRLGNRHRAEAMHRAEDPRGHDIYWIGAAGAEQDAGEGTDFYAVAQQCVSITPLQQDLTCYSVFSTLERWLTQVAK